MTKRASSKDKKSSSNKIDPAKKTDPRIVAAVIGLVGVLITVIFTSPPIIDWIQRTPTPTPECRFNNLINCSVPDHIFVPGESELDYVLTQEGLLEVNFGNNKNGSGMVFKFSPALDLQGFSRLELSGTSTQDFTFLVEYKVLVDDKPDPIIVAASSQQTFQRTSEPQTIEIPVQHGGMINQIVINFPKIGESSELTIESIRLK